MAARIKKRILFLPVIVLPSLAILTFGLLFYTYGVFEEARRQQIGEKLLAMSLVAAPEIDTQRLHSIYIEPVNRGINEEQYQAYLNTIERTEGFQILRGQLEDLIERNKLLNFNENNMYVFVIDPFRPDQHVRWAVMAHKQPFIGEPYEIRNEMKAVLNGSVKGSYTGLYLSTASNQRWISSYAPLYYEGRVIGILESAVHVRTIIEEGLESLVYAILGIASAGIVFLAFSIYLYRGNVRRAFLNKKLEMQIERKNKIQQQLEYSLNHDSLTDLPNSRAFTSELAERFKNTEHKLVVIALGIDRFKVVNSSMGYPVGDSILIEFSDRLIRAANGDAFVARRGSDEFWVLIDVRSSENEEVFDFLNRMDSETAKPFIAVERSIYITVTYGIAVSSEENFSAENLIRHAESALHEAKKSSDRYVFANQNHTNQALRTLSLENRMREAIQKEYFEPHYQPVISLTANRIVGLEALIRWNDPQHGSIGPDEFIPLAETTGLIEPIGELMFHRICRDLLEWNQKGKTDFYVAINLSARQFRKPGLAESLYAVTQSYGIAPERFEFEVTETSAMRDARLTEWTLSKLREMGFTIAIDDFGTGYSSLAYLRRLPVDTLKIDRSFIIDLQTDSNQSIVKTILALAHSLGMQVVAEGIERKEQLEILKGLNCEKGQGFFFSKPVEANRLVSMI